MTLEFEETTHTYKINGRIVPSVTGIIQAIVPGWKVAPWYLERGRATHLACHYADAGQLDWNTVDPAIAARVSAWQQFRSDYPTEVIASEKQLGHSLLGYAGTIDRILKIKHKLIVCDLKNSISPSVYLQLALYSKLWQHNLFGRISEAVAVELKANGKYACKWLSEEELRRIERQAEAFITAYGFLNEHNLLRKERHRDVINDFDCGTEAVGY